MYLVVLFISIQQYDHHTIVTIFTVKSITRLGMSVTTQGGSGRQFVTGP